MFGKNEPTAETAPLTFVRFSRTLGAVNIKTLRKDVLKLSQEEFAQRVGLRSKGHVSDLERGTTTCSVRVALEIEKLSEGQIPASSLNPSVGLVEEARGAA